MCLKKTTMPTCFIDSKLWFPLKDKEKEEEQS